MKMVYYSNYIPLLESKQSGGNDGQMFLLAFFIVIYWPFGKDPKNIS